MPVDPGANFLRLLTVDVWCWTGVIDPQHVYTTSDDEEPEPEPDATGQARGAATRDQEEEYMLTGQRKREPSSDQ
eukprot:COSAG05_NODE_3998_length_1727_cov_94.053669_2_plen_75_part_00